MSDKNSGFFVFNHDLPNWVTIISGLITISTTIASICYHSIGKEQKFLKARVARQALHDNVEILIDFVRELERLHHRLPQNTLNATREEKYYFCFLANQIETVSKKLDVDRFSVDSINISADISKIAKESSSLVREAKRIGDHAIFSPAVVKGCIESISPVCATAKRKLFNELGMK